MGSAYSQPLEERPKVSISENIRMGNTDSSQMSIEERLEEEGLTRSNVSFSVNGNKITVGAGQVDAQTKLARYLRDQLHLTGTKISCNQGGCGACMVTAKVVDPATGMKKTKGVNSCLVPVLSCDGWEITTIEGLGNKKKGFHPLQAKLSEKFGSQCGYCSPGMVMITNSLLEKNDSPTPQEVEHNFDGNICRCTGYRPILDAMKSFAGTKCGKDIEDMGDWVCCKELGTESTEECEAICISDSRKKTWVAPTSVSELLKALNKIPDSYKYKLIAGNTGTGIYEDDSDILFYLDTSKIAALKKITSIPLKFGAGVSLSDAQKKLSAAAQSEPSKYGYAKQIVDHLKYVASSSIRDHGTIGGNLMLKYAHNEFQSDVFNLLEAVGAKIEVGHLDIGGSVVTEELLPAEWLETSMHNKLLLSITLPSLTSRHTLSSYKITPRQAFAHAHVNTAILFELDTNFKVVSKPSLVYGGITASFIHATKTEDYLNGKSLSDSQVVKEAIELLGEEAQPTEDPHDPSPEYRRELVQSLFYKCVIDILGDNVDENKRSGAEDLRFTRPVSKGQQKFGTDAKFYPVNQNVEKLEGTIQASGEAEYAADIQAKPMELCAAVVQATQGNSEIDNVDPSDALKLDGVEAFLDHSSIPGLNFVNIGEPMFVDSKVSYAGQAIGIILADTLEKAHVAAKMVKVTYKNKKTPVLTIKEAIEKKKFGKLPYGGPVVVGDVNAELEAGDVTVSGEFESGSQYHFHMETQTCLAWPNGEGGVDLASATQWMDIVQNLVSKVLGIQENKINMTIKRLGGAYGGKATNSTHPAAAAALAAYKLNRPVRLVMDLASNMAAFGKRLPYLSKYKASTDADGKLAGVDIDVYCDAGYSSNEATPFLAVRTAKGLYDSKAWNLKPIAANTNKAANTWCRAPGTATGHALMENVMEHLAFQSRVDPLKFRMNNLKQEGKEMVERLKESSDYDNRKTEIEEFNQNNLWTKRGIAMIPMVFHHDFFPTSYHVNISVYHDDGSIAVMHGGIEMGQGINTKVARVVARELGVPVDLIVNKPTNNFSNPNAGVTAGCFGTEGNVAGAIRACADLKEKMAAVKTENPDLPWAELVKKSFQAGVDLSGHHMNHAFVDKLQKYEIFGASCCEVEIDVLTGVLNIRRLDFVEDTGMTTNPMVDVGQVEGSLIMGLGLWTSEELKYDDKTGELLINSTWFYKVPTALDIPADLRVELLDSGNNSKLVLGSKVTGEPPVLGAVSVLFAIRMAIASARKDGGMEDWFQLDGPATAERIKKTCAVDTKRMTP